ncbi:MAG: Secretory immunoglobulin A-binding protein EsiB [Verrucomicrobia subdivision 3 bacterium]|nr:Secretory immunoglobulin A-binding protein EsiB [Limisphaerales bacterium]MCS1414106.1 Secretory immunoglobulin A-binding protein EsiB [Limisphaerales bacterium]
MRLKDRKKWGATRTTRRWTPPFDPASSSRHSRRGSRSRRFRRVGRKVFLFRLIGALSLLTLLASVIRTATNEDPARLRQAAEQGDAWAQYTLGLRQASGRGSAKNDVAAAQWYRQAAEQGNAKAQFNLGAMHAKGLGVTQDDVEAVKWFRKAAQQGHAKAQCNLSVMYANGLGVTQNDVEGYAWALLSKARGHRHAEGLIELFEKRLTTGRRAVGQARAMVLEKQIPQP